MIESATDRHQVHGKSLAPVAPSFQSRNPKDAMPEGNRVDLAMKRRIWWLVPALAAGYLGGCDHSNAQDSGGVSPAGSGSQDQGSGGDVGTGTGGSVVVVGGAPSCPSTCEALNANCGTVTDTRCGGVIECGVCGSGEACGAYVPNQCAPAGDVPCLAKTCEELGANCGAAGDGCGDLLDCGTCPLGQACGALTPNRCDVGTSCTPLTCADLEGVECGLHGDGCGDTIDCGSCPSGEECITREGQSQCALGHSVCTPATCTQLGIECGLAGDGCGGTLDCGNTCVLPKICGGNPDAPGRCGCTGVCSQIPDCTDGTTTSVSGTVLDPAGRNPLYNALVYIPNNPTDPGLQPFTTRTHACDVCGATAAGDPLVSTQTGVDGSFTLTNVPVGQAIQLVVQMGRWRRIFEVDIPVACEANELPSAGRLTLPKSQSEGDIPLIASVTGAHDGAECVLWKAGIDTEEFTNPSGTGRVHLYQGSGVRTVDGAGPGTRIDEDTPSETALYVEDGAGHIPLTNYDMLILACQGSDYGLEADYQPALAYWRNLVDYADNGGRVFATHWSHSYMRIGGAENPLSSTATWSNVRGGADRSTGTVVNDATMNPLAAEFTAWLGLVGALDTPLTDPATFEMIEPRYNVEAVTPPGQTWVTGPIPDGTIHFPLHYTFNTPVSDGSGESCGRFVYSDFHVSNSDETQDFPLNCGPWDSLTPQEMVLEFMLFDLSSCVTPYVPLCTPLSCDEQGFECGAAGDGCGGAIDCGSCPSGEICGLLSPGQCDAFTCRPTTCEELGYECGETGNGCGGLLDCGECAAGETCGAAGPNRCGAASCVPRTCEEQGLQCGMAGDGCGHAIDCGTCPDGAFCGLGGPNQCATSICSPMTCTDQGIECGAAGDGCGAALNCGNCEVGLVCGLGGPGQCGQIR